MSRLIIFLFTLGLAGCGSGDDAGSSGGSTESVAPPVAAFTYAPETIYAGMEVQFDASESMAYGGEIVSYLWDFDSDGGVDATGPNPSEIMSYSGEYDVELTITDSNGESAKATQKLVITVKMLQR